jgi:hypothetical protein
MAPREDGKKRLVINTFKVDEFGALAMSWSIRQTQ